MLAFDDRRRLAVASLMSSRDSQQRQGRFLILARSRKARLRQAAGDRTEALAVAGATREGLEVPNAPVASDVDTANEHLAVIRAGMPAPVAKGRVFALRADLKRPPRTRKLVTAVSTQAEHITGIGKLGVGTEVTPLGDLAWASVPE
jgi:hypothetical protein